VHDSFSWERVYCFGCWSAGHILYQNSQDFQPGSQVDSSDIDNAEDAAGKHDEQHPTHNIVIYQWVNDIPAAKNDNG
jgi:hypothetical protein